MRPALDRPMPSPAPQVVTGGADSDREDENHERDRVAEEERKQIAAHGRQLPPTTNTSTDAPKRKTVPSTVICSQLVAPAIISPGHAGSWMITA